MRVHSEIFTSIYTVIHSRSFFGPASIDNRNYVLASHEHLPVHMDLPTAETGISSVGGSHGRRSLVED